MNKKIFIAWNIILSILVLYLLANIKRIDMNSKENTAQNVVLCGYINEIQRQANIDTTSTPDCQGDIKLILDSIN